MKRLTLAILLIAFTSLEGTEMKTAKFRDVLWSVARKAGYSPESGNFISNQAIPIGEYINDWVGRLYAQEDWPEWTKIIRCTPNASHVVPYEAVTGNVFSTNPFKIGRVLTVYLVDPGTTRAPISTRFTLREEGIHCGYEHGTYVWIKFIEPAPEFTAAPWRANITYLKDEVTYSPNTGECYKSLVNNNIGHDPTANFSPNPPPLTLEETQALEMSEPGLPPQDQIVDYSVALAAGTTTIPDPIPSGYSFTLTLFDTLGVSLAGHSQMQAGTTSTADLLAALKVMFDGDALPGFTFTVLSGNRFRVESTTTEFVTGVWRYFPPTTEPWNEMLFVQTQPFSAGIAGVEGQLQKLKLTIGDNEFIPGALYSITVIDLDGVDHVVEYQSNKFDNRNQILNGLLLAIGASTVPEVQTIGTALDTTEQSATLSLNRALGISAQVVPPASQYWKLVPFPDALFNPVVRGASGSLLGEWGQGDAQTREEGKVPAETQINSGDFETTPNPPFTTQQRALSRYKL